MKFILFSLILNIYSVSFADWSPPRNPDPSLILTEARIATKRRNFKEALEKHLWFHNHALAYDRSLYGVRLSYALSDWIELANKYQPALIALKKTRNTAEAHVKEGKSYYQAFHDFMSINEILGEEEKTVNLFHWLHIYYPSRAKEVYTIAQAPLLNAKEYKLCGQYLEPYFLYKKYFRNYQSSLEFTKKSSHRKYMERCAHETFSNNVATLIALLVINNRTIEANKIVKEAIMAYDNQTFSSMLTAALKGRIPHQ